MVLMQRTSRLHPLQYCLKRHVAKSCLRAGWSHWKLNRVAAAQFQCIPSCPNHECVVLLAPAAHAGIVVFIFLHSNAATHQWSRRAELIACCARTPWQRTRHSAITVYRENQTPLVGSPADPEVSHSSSRSFHAFSPAKPFTTIASQKHHSFSENIVSTTSETLEKIRAVTRLRDKPLGCPGALRRDTGAAV